MSEPKECACVITNSSAKQCDWLSHARPAPFPFPLFLFPGINQKYFRQWNTTNVLFEKNWMLRTNVHTFNAVYTVHCGMYMYTKVRARNLRQSIIIKPSIGNPILWMESGIFVNIFAKYSFMWFIYIIFLFTNFLNKIYTIYWLMLKINVHGEEDRDVFRGGGYGCSLLPRHGSVKSIVFRGFDFWGLNGCWAPRPLKRKIFQYFICICITNKFFQQVFDRSVTYIKK